MIQHELIGTFGNNLTTVTLRRTLPDLSNGAC